MKKMSRKLTVTILSVAFAFVALGATTFAWFTLSNQVTIAPFEAQVTTGSGFEVSVDDGINGLSGGNYYTNLPLTAITAALTSVKVDENFRFDHITSKDGILFKNIIKSTDTYRADTSSEKTAAGRGYIQFDLKFRSLDENVTVYLGEGTSITSVAKPWLPDTDFTKAENGPDVKNEAETAYVTGNYYLSNAARISFTGTTSSTLKTTVYQLPSHNVDNDNGNTQLGSAPVQEGAVDYYDKKSGLTGAFIDEAKTITDIVDRGLITKKWATDEVKGLPTTIDAIGSNDVAAVDLTTKGGDYYYGTITVRIWIEGWDPDCFDAIFQTTLVVNLEFTKPSVIIPEE